MVFDAGSLNDFMVESVLLPLVSHPGEKYTSSIAIDMLGYLVEEAASSPFDQFVQ